MKCIHCGNDLPDGALFCSLCGNQVLDGATAYEAAPIVPPHTRHVLAFFQDNLFLVLCILVSGATLFAFTTGSISLLPILFTVFLWLIFSKAKKGEVNAKNMRCVSGTVFAMYVVNWVLIGLLAIVSVLCIAVFALAGSAIATIDINEIFNEALTELEAPAELYSLFAELTAGSLVALLIIIFVFLLFACAVAAVINVFATRQFHRFAKAFYQYAESGLAHFANVSTVATWFLVIGIFTAVSALSNLAIPAAFLSTGCSSAAYIISYMLIKKYFLSPPVPTTTM